MWRIVRCRGSSTSPEFIAKAVQAWITAVGAQTAYIAPGSPWDNGYIESFNPKLRDERLNGEIFYTLRRPRSLSRAGESTTRRSGRTRRPATCPRARGRAGPAAQTRPAPPPRSCRAQADNALTFNPDHRIRTTRWGPAKGSPGLTLCRAVRLGCRRSVARDR
jgi:hypothetical protein